MMPPATLCFFSKISPSYLSRKAFEAGGAGAPTPEGVVLAPGAADAPAPEPSQYNPHHHHHLRGGERDGTAKPFVKGGDSIMSKTTSGLTTFEDDLDVAFDAGGVHRAAAGASSGNPGGFSLPDGSSAFKSTTDYGSEFSDDDESLGSMVSGNESLPVSHRSETGPDSVAGQIWRMLCSLDDLVLEVKVRRAAATQERGRQEGEVLCSWPATAVTYLDTWCVACHQSPRERPCVMDVDQSPQQNQQQAA